MTAGDEHSCALDADGEVTCWGDNRFGQTDPPDGPFAAIGAGDVYTCGLRTDGRVTCWGDDGYRDSAPPSGRFAKLSAAYNLACALSADGSATCWGDNRFGQTDVPDSRFESITMGRYHACGLTHRRDRRMLGTERQAGETRRTRRDGSAPSAAAYKSTCGLRVDGTVICWGDTGAGEPYAAEGRFTRITAGCGIRTDGTIDCFNPFGRERTDLPRGRFTDITAPPAVSGPTGPSTAGVTTATGRPMRRRDDSPRWPLAPAQSAGSRTDARSSAGGRCTPCGSGAIARAAASPTWLPARFTGAV